MSRDYNACEDEFGSISEEEYNKRHKKALKNADSSYKKKKRMKKRMQRKKKQIKIGDGVYQNLRYSYMPKKKKK
jgi:hypothetical protein|tara:strand:+ start:496 stop:717 length:222 start_codon:yes stop_codon:yes gene_type:complete